VVSTHRRTFNNEEERQYLGKIDGADSNGIPQWQLVAASARIFADVDAKDGYCRYRRILIV